MSEKMVNGDVANQAVVSWQRDDPDAQRKERAARHRHHHVDKNYSSMMIAITQARYSSRNKNAHRGMGVTNALPKHVINPFSVRYNIWLAFTILAAAFTGWFEIYMMAFADRPGLYPPGDGKCIIEYILFTIFGLDMLLHFRTAVWEGDELVGDPRAIARSYGRGRFLVDLVSVIPFDYIALAIMGKQDASQSETHGVSTLKLLRVVRMYRLRYFFDFLAVHPKVPYTLLVIIRNYTVVFYVVHFAACMLYYIARVQRFTDSTWVGANRALIWGEAQGGRYLYALYWSMTTLTSVGYGDLHPYTVPEIAFVIFYQASLITLTAYLMGSVTNLVIKSDTFTSRYHDRLKALLQFSSTHELPPHMEQALADHLRLHLGSEAASDEQILTIYPSAVRREVLRHMYRHDFSGCYLFKHCTGSLLDKFITAARIEMYMPDVQIIKREDNVEHLYVLVEGSAELSSLPQPKHRTPASSEYSSAASVGTRSLYHNSSNPLVPAHDLEAPPGGPNPLELTPPTVLTDGSVFGELAFFLEDESLDTLTTLTVCRVMAIDRKAWNTIKESMPEGCQQMIQNLFDAAVEALNHQETIGMPLAARSTVYGAVTPAGNARAYSDTLGLGDSSMHRASRRSMAEQRKLLKLQIAKVKVLLEGMQATTGNTAAVAGGTALQSLEEGVAVGVPPRVPASPRKLLARGSRGGGSFKGVLGAPMPVTARIAELLVAAAEGDLEVVQQILAAGISVDATGIAGTTPLMAASAEGRVAVILALLAAGADVSARDRFGTTPLQMAVQGAHEEAVDLLLAAGAKLGLEGVAEGVRLCQLAYASDRDMLRRILRAGARVTAHDYDLRTPLHIAAAEGDLETVQLLVVEAGALPGLKDRWGRTPMDEARAVGAVTVAEYLEGVTRDAEEVGLGSPKAVVGSPEAVSSSPRLGGSPRVGGGQSPKVGASTPKVVGFSDETVGGE